jgi:hypothetical protein
LRAEPTGSSDAQEARTTMADDAVYWDPCDVEIDAGAHFCIGAALARMEGRIALEETLARYPQWEIDTPPVVRLHTSTVRGFTNVPILV